MSIRTNYRVTPTVKEALDKYVAKLGPDGLLLLEEGSDPVLDQQKIAGEKRTERFRESVSPETRQWIDSLVNKYGSLDIAAVYLKMPKQDKVSEPVQNTDILVPPSSVKGTRWNYVGRRVTSEQKRDIQEDKTWYGLYPETWNGGIDDSTERHLALWDMLLLPVGHAFHWPWGLYDKPEGFYYPKGTKYIDCKPGHLWDMRTWPINPKYVPEVQELWYEYGWDKSGFEMVIEEPLQKDSPSFREDLQRLSSRCQPYFVGDVVMYATLPNDNLNQQAWLDRVYTAADFLFQCPYNKMLLPLVTDLIQYNDNELAQQLSDNYHFKWATAYYYSKKRVDLMDALHLAPLRGRKVNCGVA